MEASQKLLDEEEGAPVVVASGLLTTSAPTLPALPRGRCCKRVMLVLGAVLALAVVCAGVAAAMCYRGPLRVDFDPESDLAVSGPLTISRGPPLTIAMRFKLKLFVFNPNNWLSAEMSHLRATVSYLDEVSQRPLRMGRGAGAGPWLVPGALQQGQPNSIFAHVDVDVSLTASGDHEGSVEADEESRLVQSLLRACVNATSVGGDGLESESRPRFQVLVEITAMSSLWIAPKAPLNKLVEVAEVECPRPTRHAHVPQATLVEVGAGESSVGRWPHSSRTPPPSSERR